MVLRWIFSCCIDCCDNNEPNLYGNEPDGASSKESPDHQASVSSSGGTPKSQNSYYSQHSHHSRRVQPEAHKFMTCECGVSVNVRAITQHLNSSQHQHYLQTTLEEKHNKSEIIRLEKYALSRI